MKQQEYYKELTCEMCGKKFWVHSSKQAHKKYCSDKCKRKRANKYRNSQRKKPKSMYVDKDTGAIYSLKEDNLNKIAKRCEETGLSYGQLTSRGYAPVIFNTHLVDKEKECKPPIFRWKEHKKRKEN